MGRKLVVELADGTRQFLEQVPADNELQLQEQLKRYPELLPLGELGLVGPAVVVGRESSLDSGRVDLVLLGNGGDLALVEFKTGPQNPDFRECLAQLLDYGSDLWGMSLEDFETRVAQQYFNGPYCPQGTVPIDASLEQVLTSAWGTAVDDPVDWRERLQAQLRDGAFHYVAVAQRFTPSVLRTLQYLNSAMKSSRFSAVELVRFKGADHAAFEARFMAGAEPVKGPTGTSKTALAGVDELLASIIDDEYRHCLQDLFEALLNLDGLTVYWGTTGCSLRVAIPNRSPLSVGWIFPPGPPRWMGLTDVTLGWYEDASGLDLSGSGRAALDDYSRRLAALPGASEAKPAVIRGWTLAPGAVVSNAVHLEAAVRSVVAALLETD
ncbi:hypothetical protein EV646_109379 [Kribbella antiqua]|uniref:Uncharacterized protein n=1 Tax=Kribbella antiqua TaxID=2512217 RepID=A0A4R2IJU4_9ACTN|nr:hypothetical protein [Kribbella antiqua]TCO45204.1 hypothetical protein EV646_109379 [Kribbella antiqua]